MRRVEQRLSGAREAPARPPTCAIGWLSSVVMRQLIVWAVVVLCGLLQPTAQERTRERIDLSKLGPQVGDRVPDFSLIDQTGRTRNLQSIMGRRGAMLVFVRSADW